MGIRIIGEITEERCEKLREADHIFMEELKAAKLYNKVSQAFAVFLPIKSVGVVGDVGCTGCEGNVVAGIPRDANWA